MENNQYATLRLDGMTMSSVVHKSSINHRNESYDYKNDKYRQKPKIQKSARRKFRSR